MKRFILSLLLFISPTAILAQEGSGFGFNWGVNVSNLVLKGDAAQYMERGAKVGFSTAIYYDIALSKNLYLQPGVSFAMKGMKESDAELKTSLGYLQIPALLSYRIFIGDKHAIGINVGPTFGYALYGNVKVADDKYKIFGEYYKNQGIDCNRFEVGINSAISYYIIGHVISLSWDRGITNLYETGSDFKVKNSTIALTFGYRY